MPEIEYDKPFVEGLIFEGGDRSQSGFSQDHAYLPSKNKDRSVCRPKHTFSVKQLASHRTVAPLIFHAGWWYPESANLSIWRRLKTHQGHISGLDTFSYVQNQIGVARPR